MEVQSIYKLEETAPGTPVNHEEEMVYIPASSFLMGSNYGSDFAKPAREVFVEEFLIDATPVTLGQFQRFLKEANYETEAKKIGYADSFVRQNGKLEYIQVPNLCLEIFLEHGLSTDLPAFYISYDDASCYAAWAGKKLPTEAQLEKAAKGNLHAIDDAKFWWGDASPEGHCNFARLIKDFFIHNGYEVGIPPVTSVYSFPPNDYGVYDACGNVWRWCQDWFSATTIASSRQPNSRKAKVRKCASWNVDREFRLWHSNRGALDPHSWNSNTGFMCVR